MRAGQHTKVITAFPAELLSKSLQVIAAAHVITQPPYMQHAALVNAQVATSSHEL